MNNERAELIRKLNAMRDIDFDDVFVKAADLLAADAQAGGEAVDMVLYCPKCGQQHIDAAEGHPEAQPDGSVHVEEYWTNPPHKSHLCHGCGHIWRPSDTPTNGVERTASGKDADTHPQPQAVPQGWKLVPVEPTPEMIAAAALAVLPNPSPADFELSRKAARIILSHPNTPQDANFEFTAAAMATIIPAHRAMLSAAPAAPAQQQAQGEPEVVRWIGDGGTVWKTNCRSAKSAGAKPLITLQSHREAIAQHRAALEKCVVALKLLREFGPSDVGPGAWAESEGDAAITEAERVLKGGGV